MYAFSTSRVCSSLRPSRLPMMPKRISVSRDRSAQPREH
jgi:hypothetical protein